MLRRTTLSLLIAVVGILTSTAAWAERVRLPKTGDPAYSFDVPSGWTIFYDEFGNARITRNDTSCAVLLSVIADPAVDTMPTSDLAAQIIKSSGACNRLSKTLPVMWRHRAAAPE